MLRLIDNFFDKYLTQINKKSFLIVFMSNFTKHRDLARCQREFFPKKQKQKFNFEFYFSLTNTSIETSFLFFIARVLLIGKTKLFLTAAC